MSRAVDPCVIGIGVLLMSALACGAAPRPAAPAESLAEAPPAEAPAAATPTPPPQPGAGAIAIPPRPAAQVPPDIPAHMAWEGLGGGGVGSACVELSEAPGPGSGAPAREALLPVPVAQWCYCGVEEAADMQLEAVLTLSDGEQERLSGWIDRQHPEEDDSPLCATFSYRFPSLPPRQPITLTTRLSGRDIVDPLTPVAGLVRFEGWLPEEPLRVVAYIAPDPADPATRVFAADLRASADADGAFTAVTAASVGDPIPNVTLFVVGRDSGCQTFDPALYVLADGKMGQGCTTMDPDTANSDAQIGLASVTWTFDSAPIYNWEPCRGAPASSLRAGRRAAVLPLDAELPVFAEPGVQAEQVGYLEPGAVVGLLSGPACADGAVWWLVEWPEEGVSGWTVENDLQQTRLARQP